MHNKSVASSFMSSKSKSGADAEADKHGKVKSDAIRHGKVTKSKSERARSKEPSSIDLPKVGIRIKEIHSNFPQVVVNCPETPLNDKSSARKPCKPRSRSRKNKSDSSNVNQLNSQTSLNHPKKKQKNTRENSSQGNLGMWAESVTVQQIKFFFE